MSVPKSEVSWDNPCSSADPCAARKFSSPGKERDSKSLSEPCGNFETVASRIGVMRPRNCCRLDFSELFLTVVLSVVVFFILLWLKP